MPMIVWECIGAFAFAVVLALGVFFYFMGLAPVLDEITRAENFHNKSGDM